MTELELISGKPKIFAISSDEESLSLLKEFVEDYGYEYAGSAYVKEDIFDKLDKISPNLIFLDTDIENINLEELATDLELFNVPIILVIGALFDETIDRLLTNNPYGFLLKPLEDGEVQRSMAVAIKKHEQNILNVKTAQAKIKEKSTELVIEKSDSSFLLILCIALILMAILTKNATWLQWVLLIPSLTMLFNSIVSIKKMKPVTPYNEEDLPFISIFIPAHNEENTIKATVVSVCQSEYFKNDEPNYEVIVINDGSTDSTGEILANLKKDLPQLKIVTRHPPRSGKGKGFVLNDALTLSRGEIIGVFDADTQIKTDFLITIVQYLNGDIDGVQSRVKMFNRDENYLARMQHLEFGSFGNTLIAKDNLGSTGFLGGNGQFVKKDAIINCGKWDGFAVTEDLNLAIKIILQHISFYSFNLLIFFGFVVTIINAISWFVFHGATIIRMEAPFLVGFLSVTAFFPGIIIALLRDKPSIQELIKDIVKYYIYCFHLIPLFFLTMKTMISRKERRWSKTEHKGDKK